MTGSDLLNLLAAEVLEDDAQFSLADLSRASGLPAERVIELAEEGVIQPLGRHPEEWRFHAVSIRRLRCAVRLERDLGVNTAGAALAIELLEEIRRLRGRLRRLEE